MLYFDSMDMTAEADSPRTILSHAGLRVTKQREIILNIIQKLKGHPDADDVYSIAKRELPRINLSTVYRTLQTLVEHGVVDTHRFSEEHHHYEVRSEHQHLVCRHCGDIVECDLPMLDLIRGHVFENSGFQALSSDIIVYGVCGRCQKLKR